MNIYALLSYFAQPTVFVYSVLGLAIFKAWWSRPELRRGLRGVVFCYAMFPVTALPATEYFVLGALERQNPPSTETSPPPEAIVVLSGSVLQPDSMRPEAEPGPSTIYRCLHAADLYRKRPCPVIVSGTTSDPDQRAIGCAPVMRKFLIGLGVKDEDIIVENNSFSTYENAVACRKIIEARNFRQVYLVTDASHLPLAIGCFSFARDRCRSLGLPVLCFVVEPSVARAAYGVDAARIVRTRVPRMGRNLLVLVARENLNMPLSEKESG